MSFNPLISVIVPAYNVADYIIKTLESLDNQSSNNFEVIVIDDGSTDLTADLVDDFCLAHPARFSVIHQCNLGLYEARKTGVRAANGEYVAFLDGDDVLHSEFVKSIEDAIEKTPVDMVLFRMCRNRDFKTDNAALFFSPCENEGALEVNSLRALLLTSDTINNVVTKVTRRKCYEAFVKEEPRRISMAEDKLISSLLFDTISCASFLDKVLYFYRPNEKSITKGSFTINRFEDLTYVHEQLGEKLEKWHMGELRDAFESLYLSQLGDQLGSLVDSAKRPQEIIQNMKQMRHDLRVSKSLETADLTCLRIHRRILVRLWEKEQYGFLLLWLRVYQTTQGFIEKKRGR